VPIAAIGKALISLISNHILTTPKPCCQKMRQLTASPSLSPHPSRVPVSSMWRRPKGVSSQFRARTHPMFVLEIVDTLSPNTKYIHADVRLCSAPISQCGGHHVSVLPASEIMVCRICFTTVPTVARNYNKPFPFRHP